jgi:probable phosphomutase (TIGR03848 family)
MLPPMAVILLVRHAVAEETGTRLYGQRRGVHLSVKGREQAAALADRLRHLRLAAVYSSPLERCVETAQPSARALGLDVRLDVALVETDAGQWTGRTFASIGRTRAWRRIRFLPSMARFPGGEALVDVQYRTMRALTAIAERHPRKMVAVFSHGDPIRAALAYCAGAHLDHVQRFEVGAASVSAVALSDGPPQVLRVNDTGTLSDLVPPRTAPH